MADSLICASADTTGPTALDHYCATNQQILSTVDGDAAKTGATIGDAIHNELAKIWDFFSSTFSTKSS